MSFEIKPLAAGLYFVATPIGNARDITLRALDILASADVLAAEDTRTLRKLMEIHGIALKDRKIIAYHDHNGERARPGLLKLLNEGKSVAYASEAGTPLIADPGFALCRDALNEGMKVTTAPGPAAFVTALSISGLASDRFLFAGFPPASKGTRRSFFAQFTDLQATLGFYESPKRIHKTLSELCDIYGDNRQAAICRELTKKFEEVRKGTLAELCESLENSPVKGEIVLLVERGSQTVADLEDLEQMIKEQLQTQSVKDVAAEVAEKFGLKRRDVYQKALEIHKGQNEDE